MLLNGILPVSNRETMNLQLVVSIINVHLIIRKTTVHALIQHSKNAKINQVANVSTNCNDTI